MRAARNLFLMLLMLAVAAGMALADGEKSPAPDSERPPVASAPATSVDQVIDRVIQREKELVETMKKFNPMVETYVQSTRPDAELGSVPVRDEYYLGRLTLSHSLDERFYTEGQEKVGWKASVAGVLDPIGIRNFYRANLVPTGFTSMILPDARGLKRENYDFQFMRREFLGDVRCLLFQVVPKKGSGMGRFLGRIWVEDQEYNIVRFNGVFVNPPRGHMFMHMDSWRRNIQPGLWVPSEVYTEESQVPGHRGGYKAQTRLWGYDLRKAGRQEEFTQMVVDEPAKANVSDQSDSAMDSSPVTSLRQWQREAEDNALERLEKAALLAPVGPVDKILETVVNNLQITNNLDIQPEVRCRVLLTSPLESMTIGHTIVISRGLLDVLPDEASLAMVLSHQLAHIVLGEQLDTKYSFGDKLLFADSDAYKNFNFRRDAAQEDAADKRAIELLKNSPYADKLAAPGLFLRALVERAPGIPALTRAYLGNPMIQGGVVRMAELMKSAPALKMNQVDQIAALPLGGRIKLDPWSDGVVLMKTKPVQLLSAREKMPFEVTPVIPRLTRLNDKGLAENLAH